MFSFQRSFPLLSFPSPVYLPHPDRRRVEKEKHRDERERAKERKGKSRKLEQRKRAGLLSSHPFSSVLFPSWLTISSLFPSLLCSQLLILFSCHLSTAFPMLFFLSPSFTFAVGDSSFPQLSYRPFVFFSSLSFSLLLVPPLLSSPFFSSPLLSSPLLSSPLLSSPLLSSPLRSSVSVPSLSSLSSLFYLPLPCTPSHSSTLLLSSPLFSCHLLSPRTIKTLNTLLARPMVEDPACKSHTKPRNGGDGDDVAAIVPFIMFLPQHLRKWTPSSQFFFFFFLRLPPPPPPVSLRSHCGKRFNTFHSFREKTPKKFSFVPANRNVCKRDVLWCGDMRSLRAVRCAITTQCCVVKGVCGCNSTISMRVGGCREMSRGPNCKEERLVVLDL